MKKNESVGTMLAKLFKKLAPKVGAKVIVEPDWGIVGQITFKNGRKRYFRGSTIDLTDYFKSKAIQLTKDMGLRMCGVDLIINDERGGWWVLEVNAAPGLDHYAKSGKAQAKIVEDMYLEVLKAME